MNRAIALLPLLLAAATACSPASHADSSQASPGPRAAPAALSPGAASLADGRSIFQTGRDSNGTQIAAQHPPSIQNARPATASTGPAACICRAAR
jgi:hypothetical protein